MYNVTDEYDTSGAFMFIKGQWDSINESFVDYIKSGLKLSRDKEKQLEVLIAEKCKTDADYQNEMVDDHRLHNHLMEKTFLNAGLMYVYSQFEHYLIEIEESTIRLCPSKPTKERKWYNFLVRIKSIGNIIKAKKISICKLSGISIDSNRTLKQKWDKICEYQKIRNLIVHANGVVSKKQSIKMIAEKHKDINMIKQLDNTSDIYLSEEFVLRVIDDMTSFFNEFMNLIYENSKRIKK